MMLTKDVWWTGHVAEQRRLLLVTALNSLPGRFQSFSDDHSAKLAASDVGILRR